MILNKRTIESMYRMDWGIYHLVGRFYLARKYSPATRGLKHYIWTIDYKRSDEDVD